MEVFTVSFPPSSDKAAHQLYQEMLLGMNALHKQPEKVELTCTVTADGATIRCHAISTDPHPPGQDRWLPVYAKAAQVLADYIMREKETEIVRSVIMREYDYRDETEIAEIEKYCLPLLKETNPAGDRDRGRMRRREKIRAALQAYFHENNRALNVEGFIRFRLGAYLDDLRDIIDYAIDEYVLDQQYQDFIALLKYFVFIQEAKIPAVHLMHQGNNDFHLLDERFEPIETKAADQLVIEMIDKDINWEDMIVSTLITVSPQQVYIHTRHPDLQVIRTIRQIFENRTTICTGCSDCIPRLGERNMPKNQLYP